MEGDNLIEKLKADGYYFTAGAYTFECGLSPGYGQHYGMRSERQKAIDEFKLGYHAAEASRTGRLHITPTAK